MFLSLSLFMWLQSWLLEIFRLLRVEFELALRACIHPDPEVAERIAWVLS